MLRDAGIVSCSNEGRNGLQVEYPGVDFDEGDLVFRTREKLADKAAAYIASTELNCLLYEATNLFKSQGTRRSADEL